MNEDRRASLQLGFAELAAVLGIPDKISLQAVEASNISQTVVLALAGEPLPRCSPRSFPWTIRADVTWGEWLVIYWDELPGNQKPTSGM